MPDKPTFSIPNYEEYSGSYQSDFENLLKELENLNFPQKILNSDYTLWSSSPNEIINRLGWLRLPENIGKEIEGISLFSKSASEENFKNVLLFGMGGSSLAPELFAESFKNLNDLNIIILDTTDPAFISSVRNKINLKETVVIVSSKSGSTIETLSLMKYFLGEYSGEIDRDDIGNHFIAITDPGSMLEKIAGTLNFRKIFLNDPEIGGRFSALSFFGLVPASLAGIDLNELIFRSSQAAARCSKNEIKLNTALRLGALLGLLSEKGRNKLTIVTSDEISGLKYWIEQLVAESTGKSGKGILPVPIDKGDLDDLYGKERVFVYIRLKGDKGSQEYISKILNKDCPFIIIDIENIYDLGSQFYEWEFATAVACHIMKINPFDQPDVESAKLYTRDFVENFKESGTLNERKPKFHHDGMDFYSNFNLKDIDSLPEFLDECAKPGSYIAIQAYLNPSPEVESALEQYARKMRSKFKIAVTYGFGPRYLHSTGQLHKGDSGNGIFIQLTSTPATDLPIPDEPFSDSSSLTFGVLKNAQALGDFNALSAKGRNIISINLNKDEIEGINKLKEIF